MTMSTIKPFAGFVTFFDGEHEDASRIKEADPDSLQGIINVMFTGEALPKEYKVPQGIVAGVVLAIGEGCPPGLEPGSKIYYAGHAALTINDVKIVAATYILAYEEPVT